MCSSDLVIDMMVDRREQLSRQANNLIQLHNNGDAERLLATHALEQAEAEKVVLAASQVSGNLSDLVAAGAALIGQRRAAAWH